MHSQDQDVENDTSLQADSDLGPPETEHEGIIVAEVIEERPAGLNGAGSADLDDELDPDDELDVDDGLDADDELDPDDELSSADLGSGGTSIEDDEFAAASQPPASLEAMTPPGASPELSQQWHDIQAAFVDDPSAAVRRATEAVEAAISTLATGLQSQMNDLTSPNGGEPGQDTERLRIAMQHCRVVWQGVQDLTASSTPGAA